MERIFDLPTHVFLVHVPVVLTPIVGAAAVAIALRPSWRRRFGLPLVGAALIVMISTLLAFRSGEAFNRAIDLDEAISRHKSLAETTRLLVIGLFVVTLALVLFGRRVDATDSQSPGTGSGGQVLFGLAGATIVLAVLSAVWIVRTGHEGATVTWEGVLPDEVEATSTTAASTSTSTSTAPTTTAGTTSSLPATSASSATTSSPPTTAAAPVDDESTEPGSEPPDGAVVFADNCARCHGATGAGGRGPSLVGNVLSAAEIQAQVRVGGSGMPTFQETLTDPEIAALVQFVEAL